MAAQLVGGALLSATLQVLFDRLASREVVDCFRGNKLSDELINSLKIVLLAINAVLDDAEEKQITNPNIKQWLDELLPMKQTISWMRLQLMLCNPSWKLQVQEIPKEGVGEKPSPRPPTTSLIEESEFYGRDGDKEAIIKLLVKDDYKGSNKVCVIPIVGMGGIGETTLAQSVYNNHKVQRHFNLRSWVYVSEEFDIFKDERNLDLLQTELKERLMGMKFLNVLDDVWNEDYVDWKNMSVPFKYRARGVRLLQQRAVKMLQKS
ncbi:putative disease resistance RPP13-like protein 1 [Ziziphus jujuba]|uniref:Disease resistance RPP13-like protein 1 n=1 Tax=Ziziphus jujuba TaxID=326968 RepID=A0ABM3ZYB5_ZIZJJ|nr:putative disease resistance RPP13-like protein 1 [Ziziphus jujuba]